MKKLSVTLIVLTLAVSWGSAQQPGVLPASGDTVRVETRGPAAEPDGIRYEGGFVGSVAGGEFAPFYLSSLTHGVVSSSNNALVSLGASRVMKLDRRFSWGFGVKAWGGGVSGVEYARYNPETRQWRERSVTPGRLWLQELYGEVKYRGVYLTVGMKEMGSPLLDDRLTGGDLMRSGNTRPLPGVAAGFVDFQDIPFTRGWVQIEGEIFYGKYTDSDWWADRINRYYGHNTRGQYYIYRRAYFRTKPSERLSVTVGAQCASQFGGTTRYYRHGEMVKEEKHSARFKDFVKMFFPREDGTEGFMQGNTLGSWDLRARYRLRDDSELSFYFEWPWEDGSGIGKLNGLDGLWGLQYNFSRGSRYVRSVVIEYLDLTNQSGPLHWDPSDNPGTDITSQTTGADDYYNNAFYNPYAVYGLSMGTPMVMAPLYNTDGYMAFVGTRMRGIHLAVAGGVGPRVDVRFKLGHRKAWGNGYVQLPQPLTSTSFMLEGSYRFSRVPGLKASLSLALDHGTMPCSTFGSMLSLSYNGLLKIGRR